MNKSFVLITTKAQIAAQECAQALKEFDASMRSFRSRYHPIVWFMLSLVGKG